MDTNKTITVINSIEAPKGWENTAILIRNKYIEYFKSKPGYVSSTFYKSINPDNQFNFVNIVVWASKEAFEQVVNEGFKNSDGLNDDEMKVLGKGFPGPIKVSPGQFEIIESN
ncbi:MAG: antibiotic biosynthesis monooxygenase [Reichenbachiella sp.]|uniref:antibiotic biosynthesis monooxygenase family protein n=1 Tax=Reichenbachiella sp. TaxID=2184521 RepID=UPI003297BD3C